MQWIKSLNREEIHLHGIKRWAKYFILFLVASIFGWIYEEIYFLIADHELTNRGFLYGPYLPIYGAGAVLITLLLKRFKKNALLFFFLTMLVTGILEYAVGFILLEVWDKRLWDYTGVFLNLQGFVCLRSVVSFGIGGLFLIYLAEPLVNNITNKFSKSFDTLTLIIIPLIFVIDFIFSLLFRYPV